MDQATMHLQAARECLATAEAGTTYQSFTRREHWLAQAVAEVMLALEACEEAGQPTFGITWKAMAQRLQRLHEDLRREPSDRLTAGRDGMTAGLLEHRVIIAHWIEALGLDPESVAMDIE